jgi:hypothetical protein
MTLPQGWQFVDEVSGRALETELRREVPPSHDLHGMQLRAIAQRVGRDDVLFVQARADGAFVVHLTWNVETDARWPWTIPFRDVEEFAARWSPEDDD